ncbi:hypothetical protein [Streptomyces sp. NPDC088348]|uniref:hypothetical protein n=1 Tax=Streptomyces sp. NPDC088348 TaxID=3365853 RepID=UPI003803CF79
MDEMSERFREIVYAQTPERDRSLISFIRARLAETLPVEEGEYRLLVGVNSILEEFETMVGAANVTGTGLERYKDALGRSLRLLAHSRYGEHDEFRTEFLP